MSHYSELIIGILALQGDFEKHVQHVAKLGAVPRLVKLPADLEGLDALIIPGGETTTMNILLDRFALRRPHQTARPARVLLRSPRPERRKAR